MFANCYCIMINKPPLSILYLHFRVSETPKLNVLEVTPIKSPTAVVLSKNRDSFKDDVLLISTKGMEEDGGRKQSELHVNQLIFIFRS